MVMVVAIFGEVVCLSNGDWTTRRRVRRRPIDRAIKSPRAFRWRSLERSLSEVDFSQDDWLGSHQKTQKAPGTPIHRPVGIWTTPRSRLFVSLSQERVEKGNGDDWRFSRFFLRLRGAKDTWQTVTKNTRNTKNKKKKSR